MIKKQQGSIVLFISISILSATLIMSLAGYKHVFYQIKRSQNEVEAQKNYWIAEGGIECVFAKTYEFGVMLPSSIEDCEMLSLASLHIIKDIDHQVIAKKMAQVVKKTIVIANLGGGAAIKSTSNLYFHRNISISIPDLNRLTNMGWLCIAVRYKNTLAVFGRIVNQEPDCRSSHKTNTMMGSLGVKSDFKHDEKISPFKDIFGIAASEHNTIRDSGHFTILHGVGLSNKKRLSDCGERLENSLNANNQHIWIEGSCEITSKEYQTLAKAMNRFNHGAFIIIHDGLFSIIGAPSGEIAAEMKGIIFHFNYDYKTVTDGSNWRGTESYKYLYPAGKVQNSIYPPSFLSNVSFYQRSNFIINGVQIFETEDQSAIFHSNATFKYNAVIVQKLISSVIRPHWRKGSWYDF